MRGRLPGRLSSFSPAPSAASAATLLSLSPAGRDRHLGGAGGGHVGVAAVSSETWTAVLTEHIITGTQGGFLRSEMTKAGTQGCLGKGLVQASHALLMKKSLLITSLLS